MQEYIKFDKQDIKKEVFMVMPKKDDKKITIGISISKTTKEIGSRIANLRNTSLSSLINALILEEGKRIVKRYMDSLEPDSERFHQLCSMDREEKINSIVEKLTEDSE